MSKELFGIPINWSWVELDQLCDITSGNPAPQNKNFFKNGNVPFVRVQDMGRMSNNVYLRETKDYLNNDAIAKKNMKLFPKGSVLFTKSGMSILLNQRAILGVDMHVVSHIGICLPTKFTPSKWIYYWLKSIDFKELTHATTLPSLKLSKVQKIKIPLPPLPEQHRIVAKIQELLTRLDAGVEALKQVQAQLKRYRQSVLKAAIEGRLTAEWREQHKDELEPADKLLERIHEERKAKLWKKCKEPMSVNSSDLAKLPKGWAWIKLETICEDVLKVNPKEKPDKQFTYLDIASIDNQENKITSPKYYFGKYAPSRARQVVKTGDILFSTVRTYLKNITIVEDEYDGQIASTGFCVIRPILASNKYLFYLTIRDDFINQLSKIQRGTSYPAVRNSDVLNQAIAFPGLKEQVEIAEVIDRLFSIADEVDSLAKSELKRAQSLRQSILKRAFEGKLVPQDPNDEPASVLLERIKEEKAKPNKSKQMEMF